MSIPVFDGQFFEKLAALFEWRRDVRHFRKDPLPEGLLDELLGLAGLAPSVGLCEPWRFVLVKSQERRAEVKQNFLKCNEKALAGYAGEQAKLYAGLKLAGLDDAPVQLAVFCDSPTPQGHGLGRASMPEMAEYSVVAAVQNLWLAARAREVGVGWVSILDPLEVRRGLQVDEGWSLIAYLCIGYALEADNTPELARKNWEARRPPSAHFIER